MEQSASRSAFNFVPKPIEQLLAAHQPGTLLDVYQLGWKRNAKGDRRTSKLVPLLFILGGIAATIVSIIVIITTIATTHLIVFSIFLLPVIAILVAAGGVVGLFHSSLCVAAFSEAFVYAKNTRVTILRWHEIVSCTRELLKTKYSGTKYVYTIRSHDGRTLQWKVDYRLMQNLVKIINEHIV